MIILKAFWWGLPYPVVVLLIPWLVGRKYFHDLEHLWEWIFFFGIMVSLYLQSVVNEYFHARGLHKAATYPNPFLERVIERFYPFILAGAVAWNLGALKTASVHALALVVLLFLIAAWDFLVMMLARPVSTAQQKACDRLRGYCRRLFWYVDFVAFVGILVWAAYLYWGENERWLFAFTRLALPQREWSLRDPLFGGVVGFQMIAIAIVLLLYLIDWESEQEQEAQRDVARRRGARRS
jgi:hypothetical protein